MIAEHSEALIAAESQDNGKPVSLAGAVDIPRAQKNLEFFAGAIEHFASEAHIPGGAEFIHYTHRKSIGVVGGISPRGTYRCTYLLGKSLLLWPQETAWSQSSSEVTPVTAWMLSKWPPKQDFLQGSSMSYMA